MSHHAEPSPNDELNDMLNDQWRREHPTFPEKYRPKPKVKKSAANELTSSIIKHITLVGGWASRINTAGRVVDGKYIPGTTKLGTPDIIACINGYFVGIEVKIKDKQSKEQKQVELDIIKAKGEYKVIHGVDEWITYYKSLCS